MARVFGVCIGFVLAAWLAWPQGGAAQAGTAGGRFIQGGLGAFPGVGLQVGYVGPHSFYTVEGILYADGSPSFNGGKSILQVSGGLGAAFRPLGVLRTIGNANYQYDFDVGLRFGPSLFFATQPTRSDKNQQFSLFFEPFFRFVIRGGSGRLFFAEAGTQRSFLRAGLWFAL